MALRHAISGEVVNIQAAFAQTPEDQSQALVSTPEIEVVRLALESGKVLADYQVEGPVTLHCLKGAIEVLLDNQSKPLHSGDLMYLAGGSRCSVKALQESLALLTIFRQPRSP